MPLEHPDPIWVCDNASLAQYCRQWLALDAIALDTEFIRTDTFYPKPGLIQLGNGQDVYLIDPLAIDDWQPFTQVLTCKSLVKVLHACSEDLEIFHLLTGAMPVSLFDTQLASAYAGLGSSMGYQNLLKTLLDIDLPKDATRSNWLQRPLTEAQVNYAALDVVHLLEVYQVLLQRLEDKPQLQWVLEDCQAMTEAPLLPEPGELWKEVKRAWQLRPQQLAVLRDLCRYREQEARSRDIPRNRVIPKGSLWPMARYMPDNTRSLAAIAEMQPKVVRNDGENILALIDRAKSLPEEDYPQSLPAPLPKSAKNFGKFIKAYVQQKAEELEIPTELLLSGKMSSPILRHWADTGVFRLPDSINGWRRAIIGMPLINALKDFQPKP